MKNNLKIFKSDKSDAIQASYLSLFLYPSTLHIFVKDKNHVNLAVYSLSEFDWNAFDELIISEFNLYKGLPTNIFLHNQAFCLIPEEVYSEDNLEKYLSFTSPPIAGSTYFSTALDKNSFHLVSSVSSELKQNFDKHFTQIKYHHGATAFLSYIFKERLYQIGQEIIVSIYDGNAYFAVSMYQELTAFNQFQIKTNEDILKYTMILISQLKLDTKLVRLSIFADKLDENVDSYFSAYFRHVRIVKPFGNQKYTVGFEQPEPSNLFEASWQMA